MNMDFAPLSAMIFDSSFGQSERDSEEEILKVFELFDEEGTGFITFKSLKRVCEELNESLYVESLSAITDCTFYSRLFHCHVYASLLTVPFHFSHFFHFILSRFRLPCVRLARLRDCHRHTARPRRCRR